MEKNTLSLSAGSQTDDLISFIFNGLTDEQTDEVGLQRSASESGGIARELLTTSAALFLSSELVIVVGRLIERWLQQQSQTTHLKIIYDALGRDIEGGKCLADLEKKYADVSISQGVMNPPPLEKGGI